ALERIRAKTMAMQTSEELNELIGTVFGELTKLDFVLTRCLIMIFEPETNASRWWMANSEAPAEPMNYLVQNHRNPAYDAYLKAWKERDLKWRYALKGKVKRDWDDFLFIDTELAQLPAPVIAGMRAPEQVLLSASFNNFGCLTLVSLEPLSDEHSDIMLRFARVFDMCYTRFNDLKQAEEQAKEAQIQLALERIRAKTMAMHNSVDVGDTVATMFDELIKLGIENTARCGIAIISDNQKMELWRASYNADGNVDRVIGRVDMTVHPLLEKVYRAWKNKETVCSVELTGKDQEDYFRALNDSPEYPVQFDLASLPPRQINSDFFFQEGCVYVFTVEPLSQEEIKLFKRFAGVFGLTYRRYLDLQKAEEQAREAKIEAALEKVRGKALAMYSSADLTSTASMVFTELRKLGINPIRCGVGMYNNGSRKVALYSATSSADGDSLGLVGWVMLEGHPVLGKIYESLVSGEDYFPVLKGKQLKSYYENLLSGLSLPALPDFHPGEEQYGHFFPFPDGCLYAWAERRYDETEIRILRRFAGVIDLTFRRYNELQKSEASAREAVRAASLDRVRAEIASMRSTEDLDRITPLVWNELTTLGIPFIRCGVFIIDEEEQLIHTHLSTANGKALATFNLPFDSQGISQNVLPAWREKQAATIHWSKEEFAEYTSNLVDEGTVKSQDKYVTEHPDTSLDLHFLPFLQGMLYVGNINPLTVDEMDLVQSLADAFSTAYARYEDFNKLEAAKEQVENTLTDLKAAQTKLIQSEKMASLGELTAGIAHEIQNPLNFVNNFSEVNQEMIDELADELKAGNIEEALAIAADIKDNEQKINHHGKRVDGIVKGMLQHSRTGGGEKTQTNINALADEFMRLSYHGLRAKDKVFNAELVTHFDPNLPKISVIGQDIGRVLLNLFNNAFYAVNQKKKALNGDYKPEVTVTTSTENGQVVIKVKDNGTGIPDAIKEKIMQPFFTTKPTGEGTGLGLSLTYDMVVKGHGGSIQANSKEGEYCEFIISLPLS
ncbi:MAG: ATP-binding protein, partial [Mucilaginibacter sp.]